MQQQSRPRTAVLADIWPQLGLDADVFTNKDGAPLARTVKCLIDPLIIRPRLNPELARPILDPPSATRLQDILIEASDSIAIAARWYRLLRDNRRRMGISDGNPQEMYFPRAWELAIQHGHPGPFAEQICGDLLAEIHVDGGHRIEQLTAHLNEPATETRCRSQLADGWRSTSVSPPDDAALAELVRSLHRILDQRVTAADREVLEQEWDDLLDGRQATELGTAICHFPRVFTTFRQLLAHGRDDIAVSAHDPVPPPPYREHNSDVLTLDRSISSRAKAALRRRSPAPTITALVEQEVARAAQPWGLGGADVHAAFVAGLAVAAHIQVIGTPRVGLPTLVGEIQAKIRKQAYVLHLRRLWCAGQPIHPRQQRVVAELVGFWRPYLRRLWSRLHGRDVTGEPELDAVEIRELLAGIARSVTLDQRQRIRDSLERRAG